MIALPCLSNHVRSKSAMAKPVRFSAQSKSERSKTESAKEARIQHRLEAMEVAETDFIQFSKSRKPTAYEARQAAIHPFIAAYRENLNEARQTLAELHEDTRHNPKLLTGKKQALRQQILEMENAIQEGKAYLKNSRHVTNPNFVIPPAQTTNAAEVEASSKRLLRRGIHTAQDLEQRVDWQQEFGPLQFRTPNRYDCLLLNKLKGSLRDAERGLVQQYGLVYSERHGVADVVPKPSQPNFFQKLLGKKEAQAF